jgi:hypothetical protein
LSGSRGSGLRVAVLDTGEGDPEVSGDANALVPLVAGDGNVDLWLLDVAVLLGLVGCVASSVVGHLIELPSVELVGGKKTVLGGPGNIEVLSDLRIVGSP